MTAATDNRTIHQVAVGVISEMQMPIYLSTTILEACMVSSSSGYAVSATSSSGAVMGVSKAKAVETSGASGGANVNLLCGAFWMNNGSAAITQANVGSPCYVEDNQTVGTSNGGSVAGCVLAVDATMGVLVGIHPMFNYIAAQATLQSNLLDYANGAHGAIMLGVYDAANNFTAVTVEAALAEIITIFAGVTSVTGANKVGYDDSGSKTAATTAADALDEIYVHLTSATAMKPIPLGACILAAGTPMAAWTDNSGASAPGITLANSKAVGLRWNNYATQTAVFGQFEIPKDIDTTVAPSLKVIASKVGATLADATTFTVTLFNQHVGALHDADTNWGAVTGAMTGDAASKTVQAVTAALVAADLPTAGEPVTFSIQPTNGTNGTDDVIVHSLQFVYTRKLATS